MPVSLNTFINHANTIDGDRSIYLNRHDSVKDHGKVGTFFTRTATFQRTTQAFIDSLRNEFGDHIGEMAHDLLRGDLEAGRPLKACQVKAFVELGKQHQLAGTLQGVVNSKAQMNEFVQGMTGMEHVDLSDEQFRQLGACVRQCGANLVSSAFQFQTGSAGGAGRSLMDGRGDFMLKRMVDLVVSNPQSPLVQAGGANSLASSEDKLRALSMLQARDGVRIPDSLVAKGMAALETLRSAQPEGEFTSADLFNAMYPPETTTPMARPSDAELALFTPKQMTELVRNANVASLINDVNQELKLTHSGGDFLARKVEQFLTSKLDTEDKQAVLLDSTKLREMLPPSASADPKLTKLAGMLQSQRGQRFCQAMPERYLDSFVEATSIMGCVDSDMSMGLLADHKDELKAMYDEGTMDSSKIWTTIFHEPMPEATRLAVEKMNYQGKNALSDHVFDLSAKIGNEQLEMEIQRRKDMGVNMDKVALNELRNTFPVKMGLIYSCGFNLEKAMEVMKGKRYDHITLADLRPESSLIIKDSMEDTNSAEICMLKDFLRMNVSLSDVRGKLAPDRANSSVTINLPSSAIGAPGVLAFNPEHPAGLSDEELTKYNHSSSNVLSQDVHSRLTEFCGKEHPLQISNVMMSMSQCGQSFMFGVSAALDVNGTEHGHAHIEVSGDDQHNVHVKYRNVEDSPLRFNWELIFAPDGSQQLVSFDMSRADA